MNVITLDFETQASYDITVRVDDNTVGANPDDAVNHTLIVTDVNEVPTITLTNLISDLGENADTSSAIRIADIVVSDDALGSETLTLSGTDAASFEIVGSELRLRAGTVLDHIAKPDIRAGLLEPWQEEILTTQLATPSTLRT